MASSLEDGRTMIAVAGNVGRIHAVVQNRRYIDGGRGLKAFVDSGAIGALLGSFMGTTGASILMVRPLIRANDNLA